MSSLPRFAALLVTMLAATTGTSFAADILVATFTGTLTSTSDPGNLFNGATIGETVTGSFTIDPSGLSADQCPGYTTGGCYSAVSTWATLSVTINGVTQTYTATSGDYQIKDEFAGHNTDWFQPHFADASGLNAYLGSTAIDQTVINDVTQAAGGITSFSLTAGVNMGTTTNTFQVGTTQENWSLSTLDVTSEEVPEPGSLVLLAAGMIGIGTVRRRWSRKPAAC